MRHKQVASIPVKSLFFFCGLINKTSHLYISEMQDILNVSECTCGEHLWCYLHSFCVAVCSSWFALKVWFSFNMIKLEKKCFQPGIAIERRDIKEI